jgi:hypothetical protein
MIERHVGTNAGVDVVTELIFTEIAAASVDHLRRYIELLFQPATRKGRKLP